MTWSIEGRGGGFSVKLWLTCRIGGGAWWWVCRGIVDLLKKFIVWLELCCRILCWWGWWAWCCCYTRGASTNAAVKDVVGSCILACIHWWSGATAQAHLCRHRVPHALIGILKRKAKVFMIGWMLLQESLIFYLLRNQLIKVRRYWTGPFWNLQGKIRHFISVKHLIAVQTLASKYTWHLLDLRYAPSPYCRAVVASEIRNCDLDFARSDEARWWWWW